ncbi:TPA: type IV pilus biogenesis/stability protein PilW [Legionella pneumophila]|nr:type IV pilus biogenesis/stability protein PilW [Legionella pneumophila]HDU7980121.1 type IV pilus biogenesis/stability protein PilW [Legionella pneumophila]HDU7983043.1 type IV pilus biogenesis/stability protein PilW [Legionella pneumophila]HDU7986532.1 type IV pilus biogenesis/stability protein PilW [Legionella pneumophila]HDU7989515.1 type IV pilus biogenesis/stability protein PilW [Legionella pneumophila]
MLKSIRYLLTIIICLFVGACQHTQDGDRPRAKKKLLTALEQQPDSADVNAALAYYFEQTKELEQAKKFYHKAITLSQNGGAQLNNYGAFLCRQGDYKNAETYFLKAVKDQNYVHTSGAYENAGLCAMAIPDHDKAILYFTKALNQDPSRKESLYELVKLQSKIGHDKEAVELLQKHADLVLNDKVMLALAKDIANRTGQHSLAAEYENSFNKLEPTNNISGVNDEYNSSNG